MSNRDFATQYLREYWYKNTPLFSLWGLTQFETALRYYDRNHPTFLDTIGSVVRSASQPKVRDAWAKVARQYGTSYPPISAFFDALASEVKSFGIAEAKEVARDTVSDIGKAAAFGLGGALVAAGIVAAVYFLMLAPKKASA